MHKYSQYFLANLPTQNRIAFEEEISNEAEHNLKQLIARTEPTVENLYPHEILFLSYAEAYSATQKEFPKSWQTLFGIYYPEEILAKLVQENFLTIDEETSKYLLTESGSTVLDKYQYIIFVHQHPFCNLGIWTIHWLMQKTPEKNYFLIIYERYLQFCHAYLQSHNYIGYRNTLFQMSKFFATLGYEQESLLIQAFANELDLNLSNENVNDKKIEISFKTLTNKLNKAL